MTSDDTHSPTQALLDQHDLFGMEQDQIHLLKQEKVVSPLCVLFVQNMAVSKLRMRHLVFICLVLAQQVFHEANKALCWCMCCKAASALQLH